MNVTSTVLDWIAVAVLDWIAVRGKALGISRRPAKIGRQTQGNAKPRPENLTASKANSFGER
jgi:hypothetical protein